MAVLAFVLLVIVAPPALAAPGDIDSSFGSGGRVRTDFAGFFDIANDALVQGNGRVVAVGQAATGTTFGSNDFAIARYTAGGDPDPAFSGDGRQRTDFSGMGDTAEAVAQQDDGKLVAAGSSETAAGGRFALARYTTNGHLDTTFSGDGKVRTAFPGFDSTSAADVAVQGDGRIVAVGNAIFVPQAPGPGGTRGGPGVVSDVAVARYKPNGSLDPAFGGGDGLVTTDFGGAFDLGSAVTFLPSGAILVAGLSQTPALEQRLIAVRYLSNGTRDGSFSGDGKVVVDMVAGESESVAGLAVRPDGRIVIGGTAHNAVTGSSGADLAVLRLKANGGVDATFGGGDGKAFADFGGSEDPDTMLRQDDGKLVFVATRPPPQTQTQAIWVFRLTGAGAPDTGFGAGGRAKVEFSDSVGGFGGALDQSGRIVAVGRVGIGSDGDFAATRLEG
ncbi:MAG: hypothetical protein ACJ77A_15585 [Actinomycetota bacterium]